jgi:hypothetical protein
MCKLLFGGIFSIGYTVNTGYVLEGEIIGERNLSVEITIHTIANFFSFSPSYCLAC